MLFKNIMNVNHILKNMDSFLIAMYIKIDSTIRKYLRFPCPRKAYLEILYLNNMKIPLNDHWSFLSNCNTNIN